MFNDSADNKLAINIYCLYFTIYNVTYIYLAYLFTYYKHIEPVLCYVGRIGCYHLSTLVGYEVQGFSLHPTHVRWIIRIASQSRRLLPKLQQTVHFLYCCLILYLIWQNRNQFITELWDCFLINSKCLIILSLRHRTLKNPEIRKPKLNYFTCDVTKYEIIHN